MATAHDVMAKVAQAGRRLREAIPEGYAAYAAMQPAMTGAEDGVPAWRDVAGGRRSKQVAILMKGGPGTVWEPRAFAAVEEYRQGAE